MSEAAGVDDDPNVDPAETRTPVVRTLCKKYEAYIEIKAGIVIPVEWVPQAPSMIFFSDTRATKF